MKRYLGILLGALWTASIGLALGAGPLAVGPAAATNHCGSPPRGFGSAWASRYAAWCRCMGGTYNPGTTACTGAGRGGGGYQRPRPRPDPGAARRAQANRLNRQGLAWSRRRPPTIATKSRAWGYYREACALGLAVACNNARIVGSWVLNEKGLQHYRRRQYASALDYFRRSLAMEPKESNRRVIRRNIRNAQAALATQRRREAARRAARERARKEAALRTCLKEMDRRLGEAVQKSIKLDRLIKRDQRVMERHAREMPTYMNALNEWRKGRKEAYKNAALEALGFVVGTGLTTGSKAMLRSARLAEDNAETLIKVWARHSAKHKRFRDWLLEHHKRLARQSVKEFTLGDLLLMAEAVRQYYGVRKTLKSIDKKQWESAGQLSAQMISALATFNQIPKRMLLLGKASPWLSAGIVGIEFAYAGYYRHLANKRIDEMIGVQAKQARAAAALHRVYEKHREQKKALTVLRARLANGLRARRCVRN